jgi:peptidoglycan/LPS O-acetylase OafA/YrhL
MGSPPENSAALHADDLVPNLPASENKRFYPALDGLRAIAVLMVFYQHYLSPPDIRPALNWGWTGVDIFFVLSGFLITGILYDTRHTLHRFRNFYVRRTLRIFPLYYGVLLIGLLLTPVFHWVWHPVWILWPLYLGNYGRFIWLNDWMQGTGVLDHLRSSIRFDQPFFLYFGHFWSLCVEEQFYLVWPLLVFLIKDRVRLRDLCIAVCILCLIARILCAWLLPQDYIDAEFLYRFTPLRADALLLGGAIALMLRGPEAERLKQYLRPACSVFVVGFVIFEILYRHAALHFYYPVAGAPILDTLGYTLIDLFAGIVILLSLQPAGTLYRMLTIKPLRRLGQMSYGFYVFHDIPHLAYGLLVDRVLPNISDAASSDITAAVALAGTLLLSYLSFRFFESPFLRLKERFAAQR